MLFEPFRRKDLATDALQLTSTLLINIESLVSHFQCRIWPTLSSRSLEQSGLQPGERSNENFEPKCFI